MVCAALCKLCATAHLQVPMRRRAHNPQRLGRVECAILDALDQAGGFIQREGLVDIVYPRLHGGSPRASTPTLHAPDVRTRVHAHATVSRAIGSLERKELIARDHNARTGRTFLRCAELTVLPVWEEVARAEEDFAAHCGSVAHEWSTLARRGQLRAARLRAEHSVEGTERERCEDLSAIAKLEAKTRVKRRLMKPLLHG